MPPLFAISPLSDYLLQRLEARFDVTHVDDLEAPVEWLQENGARIERVLTDGHWGIAPEYLSALPDLKLISNYGVGYDGVDTDACVERSIIVTHTPDVLNEEVATTALMLMLASLRELRTNEEHVRSGDWAKHGNAPLSRSADNLTIGIVGMGRIGQAIARKLEPFSPKLLYHTRSEKDVPYTYCPSLVDMAEASDVLIIITPGGAATRHLINEDVINALGAKGTLVNVSRGTVVDETALIAALQDGRLGAAALDVFEHEPQVPQILREMTNVVLTPHIGSGTHETRQAMADLAVDNLIKHLDTGRVLTPVPECQHLTKS